MEEEVLNIEETIENIVVEYFQLENDTILNTPNGGVEVSKGKYLIKEADGNLTIIDEEQIEENVDRIKVDIISRNTLLKEEQEKLQVEMEQKALEEAERQRVEFEASFPQRLESAKVNKIADLSAKCRYTIVNEFYSDCLGESKRFDCDPTTDQSYIQGMYFLASMMVEKYPAIADTPSDELLWKEGIEYGVLKCYAFTPNQMIKLGLDMKEHIKDSRLKFEDLRILVLGCETIESIEEIVW